MILVIQNIKIVKLYFVYFVEMLRRPDNAYLAFLQVTGIEANNVFCANSLLNIRTCTVDLTMSLSRIRGLFSVSISLMLIMKIIKFNTYITCNN